MSNWSSKLKSKKAVVKMVWLIKKGHSIQSASKKMKITHTQGITLFNKYLKLYRNESFNKPEGKEG